MIGRGCLLLTLSIRWLPLLCTTPFYCCHVVKWKEHDVSKLLVRAEVLWVEGIVLVCTSWYMKQSHMRLQRRWVHNSADDLCLDSTCGLDLCHCWSNFHQSLRAPRWLYVSYFHQPVVSNDCCYFGADLSLWADRSDRSVSGSTSLFSGCAPLWGCGIKGFKG